MGPISRIQTSPQWPRPSACAASGIEDPAQIENGIAAALAHDGPVLIDAVVNRSELVMPPAITVEMAKGFSLYMLRAVMNGQADQVVDLAQSNLWR
jgi:pyruvate dehydrogenase (quinone)